MVEEVQADEEIQIEQEPKKKGFLGLFGGKKNDKSDIVVGEGDMPTEFDMQQGPPQGGGGDDLMARLLGGAFGGGQGSPQQGMQPGPGRSQFYQDDWQYQSIGDSYRPINETYQAPKYQKQEYKKFEYESPGYESAADELFGPARGPSFANANAVKETGVWNNMNTPSEKTAFTPTGMNDNLFGGSLADSPLFKPTGMNEQLFQNFTTPIMTQESSIVGGSMMTPPENAPLRPGNMTTLFGTPIETPTEEYVPKSDLTAEQEAAVSEVFPEEEMMSTEEAPVEESLELPAETVAPQAVAPVAAPYIPKPTVQMRPQLATRRGPGRPRLSDEEKANRKAARMAEASMAVTQ